MGRSDLEKTKAFISRSTDRFRPPYGRHVIEVPRQSIFIGTTNDDNWNKDATGARRFNPIQCKGIDLAAIKRDRDQLWAEAVRAYRNGVQWWLTPDETKLAVIEQDARYDEDVWMPKIAAYLESKQRVTVADVLSDGLCIDTSKLTKAMQMRVADCLRKLCWVKGRNAKNRWWYSS
jgi:predicted P-loop ATPase